MPSIFVYSSNRMVFNSTTRLLLTLLYRSSKRLTRRLECWCASLRHPAVSVSEVDAAKVAWYDQRCTYRRLRQCKCIEFWSERIEADRADPCKLWSSVNVLFGRGSSHSSAISGEDFCRSFADKVAKMGAATADADAPSFSGVQTSISLQSFTPCSVNDVVDAICLLPDKCSAADPIPTYAL